MCLERASIIAWMSWLGYTLACAWPTWTCPWWVYPVACLGYGLLATRWGSALGAGAAGACAAAPLLCVSADDHGIICAGVGFILAAVVCAAMVLINTMADVHGQMRARSAALLLWIATTGAGVWGLVLADVVAFVFTSR